MGASCKTIHVRMKVAFSYTLAVVRNWLSTWW